MNNRLPLISAIFLAIPLVEIALFIIVGKRIGVLPTLALCVLSAAAGIFLVRRQGMSLLLRARRALSEGEVPAGHAAEGALIVLAGLLLITPGFFTDALGFSLLVPAVRRWVLRELKLSVRGRFGFDAPADRRSGDGKTIEGEATEIDPGARRLDSPWRR